MYKNDELLQLFPTPVLIANYPSDYSKELQWIRELECNRINGGEIEGIDWKSSHGNRQSDDTFVLDKPELKKIRKFIDIKVNKYVKDILGSSDQLMITQSWVNKTTKGESHHEHGHPNSLVSGVWYPVIHDKLPPIQFKTPMQRDVSLKVSKFNTFNGATFLLPLNKGELILFPSNLSHSVPSNQSDEERISLSFNTWCINNLGDIESLTYLPLDRLMQKKKKPTLRTVTK